MCICIYVDTLRGGRVERPNDLVGQGLTVLAVGAGRVCLDFFSLFLFLPARRSEILSLNRPLHTKQPTDVDTLFICTAVDIMYFVLTR